MIIDGIYHGNTPLTIQEIEPGTYLVSLSKSGYMALSTPALVEPGKTTQVTGMLYPSTGSLAINTSPSGARVLLDNADSVYPRLRSQT